MQKKDTERSRITFYERQPICLTLSQKNQVKNMIHALAKSIINDIDYKKKTKLITKQPNTYVQHRVSALSYTKNGLNAGSTTQRISKKDWSQAIAKCKQEVLSLPEYVCLKTFLQKYTDEHQKYFVVRLSEHLVEKHFERDLSKSISKIKNTFIKDLEMKPSTSYVVAEVFGLQLKQPKIMLTEKLQICRTTKRDLEFEKPDSFESIDYGFYPESIFQFESNAGIPVRHMTKLVIAALCLYKVGAVKLGKLVSYSDSIINHGRDKEIPGTMEKRGWPITFTRTDCKKFPEFWKKFQTFLSYKPHEIFTRSYLNIAYDRYYDSFMKGEVDFRIANIIMCLEALLLDENQAITYKLQTRATRLLSTLGFDSCRIFQDISLAYSIRSAFVHGGVMSKNEKKKLKDIFRHENMAKEVLLLRIQEYTRIIFLIVLLCGKEKTKLIRFLTMAQIDTSSLKKFERMINSVRNYLNVAQTNKWQNSQYLVQKLFDKIPIVNVQNRQVEYVDESDLGTTGKNRNKEGTT